MEEHSVPACQKTINSYGILLAKHHRTKQWATTRQRRATYERAPPPLIYDAEFEIKCSYVTLVTWNNAQSGQRKEISKGSSATKKESLACANMMRHNAGPVMKERMLPILERVRRTSYVAALSFGSTVET
jgi:hypothetical protein